jgi:hypothetical protein
MFIHAIHTSRTVPWGRHAAAVTDVAAAAPGTAAGGGAAVVAAPVGVMVSRAL